MSLGVEMLRRSAMRNALALSGVFVVVLALCGVWLVAQIRADVRDEIDTQLQMVHRDILADGVTEKEIRGWFQGQDELIYFTEAYRPAQGPVLGTLRADVFDTLGYRTLAATELFHDRYLAAYARELRDLDGLDPFLTDDLEVDSWRVLVASLETGRLAVFEPISGVEDALGLIPRVVLTVGVALVVTTLLAGALLAWRQQARLDQIRHGITRIGQGDLSQPMAPARIRDDLDEIMLGIDGAAQELDGSISRLRLFSQNVAHELRTPLARLRATLEDTPDMPEEALERTDEVIRTLDAVQRIARLSQAPAPGTLTPVTLADVAKLAEELFGDVADENGQNLTLDLQKPGVVHGDFQLIAQMVSNLVENAIRYAGQGAEITVRVDGPCLCVRDTGPGITCPQDLTEAFARGPDASAQARDGSGLGLALVKAIALYHGAELTLNSDYGLEARVVFPA